MSITCTRCEGFGFINLHQIPEKELDEMNDDLVGLVPSWIGHNPGSDVSVCDCCGDGEDWYGEPGQHYNKEDPQGKYGPYSYNGGYCECH